MKHFITAALILFVLASFNSAGKTTSCNDNGICEAGENLVNCAADCSCNNDGKCNPPRELQGVCRDCKGATPKAIGPGPNVSCDGKGDLASCSTDWDCSLVYGPNWICGSGKCAYSGNYSSCDDGTPLGGCSPAKQRCMEGPTGFGSILVDGSPCCANVTCQNDQDPSCYIDKTITSDEYIRSYFTIYKNVIGGSKNFDQNELNDVVVYFITSKDDASLSSYLYSRGPSSKEVIGSVLNKAGANFGTKSTHVGATFYCYNTVDVYGRQCCADNTVQQGYCYNDMTCDSSTGYCKSGGGTNGCYMTTDTDGNQCCHDDTNWPGYCYPKKVCDSSTGLCKDSGGSGCSMTTDVYGNPCCIDSTNTPGYCWPDRVCDTSTGTCKATTTTTSGGTTTTNINQCSDGTPLGKCSTANPGYSCTQYGGPPVLVWDLNCQGGGSGCYMTTDTSGASCCVDSTNTPGKCWPGKTCDTTTGLCKDSGGGTRCDQVCSTSGYKYYNCDYSTCQSPFVPLSGSCAGLGSGSQCCCSNTGGGGSGCYMTTDTSGSACCVDPTNTPGYCWAGKTCDTSTGLCKDSGGGTRCDLVCGTAGFTYYNCDSSTCQSPFVARIGSCAGLGSGSQCCCGNSGGGSSGCYMTTDVNTGQPCCVDATCALGKCWLNRNCNIYGSCTGGGGGNCDDNKKDVNGIRCCVDDTSTPGYCYPNSYCLATTSGRRCVSY